MGFKNVSAKTDRGGMTGSGWADFDQCVVDLGPVRPLPHPGRHLGYLGMRLTPPVVLPAVHCWLGDQDQGGDHGGQPDMGIHTRPRDSWLSGNPLCLLCFFKTMIKKAALCDKKDGTLRKCPRFFSSIDLHTQFNGGGGMCMYYGFGSSHLDPSRSRTCPEPFYGF